ncbi:VOC family protein [Terricaulis silvestris]|uniref:Glyoxalase-like domain protein n=1 Tax=Terricaulis silvestris TaxID=2686094 RepID=A0A6I6MVR0_9CAUL|nr:VOC family protein [Terricaulis silvestris]QGZ95243.1 Glyoxalase-like domain protein [Terricaulis silvestris]
MSGGKQIFAASPVLLVADVVKAHDYYATKLGMRSPKLWGDPPRFAIPQRDEVSLMLNQVDQGAPIHPNANYDGRADAYFWVRDADALHAEFKAAGADIVCEPQDEVYMMREFSIRDFDGHLLIFGHDISGAA